VYKHLVENIIPDYAEYLDANINSLDNIEEFIYNLHSRGINVRLVFNCYLFICFFPLPSSPNFTFLLALIQASRQLGLLRSKVTNEEVKKKILVISPQYVKCI
jgi:hypothetical protein